MDVRFPDQPRIQFPALKHAACLHRKSRTRYYVINKEDFVRQEIIGLNATEALPAKAVFPYVTEDLFVFSIALPRERTM